MRDWQASIFFGAGGGEARLWSINIHAGDKYPSVAPEFKFTSKISLDCVDARGNVSSAKVPYLASWNPSKTMLGALQEIKALMARAPRAQPPEGTNY
jgi:ubiquitin-conjugating enzyme E2 variant